MPAEETRALLDQRLAFAQGFVSSSWNGEAFNRSLHGHRRFVAGRTDHAL